MCFFRSRQGEAEACVDLGLGFRHLRTAATMVLKYGSTAQYALVLKRASYVNSRMQHSRHRISPASKASVFPD